MNTRVNRIVAFAKNQNNGYDIQLETGDIKQVYPENGIKFRTQNNELVVKATDGCWYTNNDAIYKALIETPNLGVNQIQGANMQTIQLGSPAVVIMNDQLYRTSPINETITAGGHVYFQTQDGHYYTTNPLAVKKALEDRLNDVLQRAKEFSQHFQLRNVNNMKYQQMTQQLARSINAGDRQLYSVQTMNIDSKIEQNGKIVLDSNIYDAYTGLSQNAIIELDAKGFGVLYKDDKAIGVYNQDYVVGTPELINDLQQKMGLGYSQDQNIER